MNAVPRLTFSDCAGPAEREQQLAEIDAVLAAPPARWRTIAPARWREALGAIVGSDAVVIAGGGNLSRSWPEQVFERAVVVRAARRAGRAVAITGQTIGPMLDKRTRDLVSEVLAGCVFVGVREEHSYKRALDLGARRERTFLQFDDAIGLKGVEPGASSGIALEDPFIAVTMHPLADASDPHRIVQRLATQLVELSRRTGTTMVLVPHVGDLGGAPVHDVAMAHAIRAATHDSPALCIAPLPSPEEAVWYCHRAELVVSTRYHPTVFATATGTPALFLYQDRYTQVKGQGALALVGLQGWTLSVGLAVAGLLAPAALELWSRRSAVSGHLRGLTPTIQKSRRQHVGALLGALDPARWPHMPVDPIDFPSGPSPEGDWVERADDGLAFLESLRRLEGTERQLALMEARAKTAEDWATVLTSEVGRKEAELATAHSALAECAKQRQAGPARES